jgi:ATP-dependent Clp protease ATP-binding subunit ClpA
MGEAHKHERVEEFESFEAHHIEVELGKVAIGLEGFSLAELGNKKPYGYIEDGLNEEIIGQPTPIESIVTALYREEFRDPNRPIVSMMFLGPTGVGKSELAKVLNKLLHDDDNALVAIDCSEISENHKVSALLGAAPEYVGREQAPMLDRKKIERPRSVILFDEIEKGAPALHNLLLQILDNGEVTLLKDGKKVSFRNSIIILTSNIGSSEMMKAASDTPLGFNQKGGSVSKEKVNDAAIKALLGSGLKPELINRIDEKIVFNSLNDEELGQILDRHIRNSNEKYLEKGIHLSISQELRDAIVTSCAVGADDRRIFGARPILSKYRKWVEGLTARYIASGGIPNGSRVRIELSDDVDLQGVSIQERIKVYQRQDSSLTYVPKHLLDKTSGKKKEIKNSTVTNSQLAIGVAAVATIAGGLFLDYLGSRRRARRAY